MTIREADAMIVDPDAGEGRFSRFELISWWEQKRLLEARVLVGQTETSAAGQFSLAPHP